MKPILATMLGYVFVLGFAVMPTLADQAQIMSEPKEDGGPLDHLAEHEGDIYKTHALEKVVELLEVLKVQIEKEGEEEKTAYDEIKDHFQHDEKETKDIVEEKSDLIEELTAALKEAEASRSGMKLDLEQTINQMSKNEQELSAARKVRKKDRAEFEKNEATSLESLDQLNHAMEVLKKRAPTSATSSASLLSVAHALKKTLAQSSDFSLSRMQQQTLNDFVRTAELMGEKKTSVFLQEGSGELGPFGEFQKQSSSVLGTLQELHGKVQSEKDAEIAKEMQAKTTFKEFEEGLQASIEDGKKGKADIEVSIMQSQQQSSQDEANLLESKQIFKAESKHLEEIQNEFRTKTEDYKIRLKQRMDENIAVHTAQRILSQSVYHSYLKNMDSETESGATTATLLQLLQKKHTAHVHGSTEHLSFLAIKSAVHVRSDANVDDPYGKVKNMIHNMLEKLLEKQNQETEHAGWCDKEQAKTAKEHEQKKHDVEKTADRLEALAASLTETKAEIQTTSKDLYELTASFDEAERLRADEHKRLTFAIKMYKDGVLNLKRAMKVLKGYYEVKAEEDNFQGVRSKGQKHRKGLSTGVIGILEVAVADFDKLHSETKTAEKQAQADFDNLRDETDVRTAVFRKSLEHLNSRKVKLEFDESTMQNDLKSYKKQVENISSYMEELKSQCVVQGSSYEERKAKREEELASLKEALTVLSSS